MEAFYNLQKDLWVPDLLKWISYQIVHLKPPVLKLRWRQNTTVQNHHAKVCLSAFKFANTKFSTLISWTLFRNLYFRGVFVSLRSNWFHRRMPERQQMLSLSVWYGEAERNNRKCGDPNANNDACNDNPYDATGHDKNQLCENRLELCIFIHP